MYQQKLVSNKIFKKKIFQKYVSKLTAPNSKISSGATLSFDPSGGFTVAALFLKNDSGGFPLKYFAAISFFSASSDLFWASIRFAWPLVVCGLGLGATRCCCCSCSLRYSVRFRSSE